MGIRGIYLVEAEYEFGANFGSAPVIFLITFGILVLLLVAWFGAIDLAISRMSKAFVQGLVDDNYKGAERLLRVVENRRATTLSLLGARVSGQALGVLSIVIGLVDLFMGVNWTWWEIWLISLLIVGILELLVVATLPYKLVGSNPRSIALAGAGTAERLRRLTAFINPLLEKFLTDPDENPTLDPSSQPRSAIAEDLREMADEMLEDSDVERLEEEDKEILRSVFGLGQTRVGELMVPRTEMITISADQTAGKALRLFTRSGFSRIPVVGSGVDDVLGVLYFKDVVARLNANPKAESTQVGGLCRQAAFVPEMKLADDELREMQQTNTHLALVVDEYGGIAGLITIEDILEELVGELHDEHDRNIAEPQEVAPGKWRVPTSFSVTELGELFGLRISDDDVYSAGGLLTKAIGRVPLPGATAEVLGLHLEAEEAIGRRRKVGTLLASLAEPEPESEETEGEVTPSPDSAVASPETGDSKVVE